MKIKVLAPLAVVAVITVSCSPPGAPAAASPTPVGAAGEGATVPVGSAQTAESLMKRFVDAWNGPDYEALEAMFATDVVAFNAGGAVIEGRENVAAAIQSDMRNAAEDGRQMVIEPLRSQMGGNVAYHAGQWRHVYAGGEPTAGGAFTFTFSRNDRGEWRIASMQIDRGGAAEPLPTSR